MDRLIAAHKQEMELALEATREQLSSVRTGRASAAVLNPVRVDYYGAKLPINQLATISVPEPRLIVITPWDKSSTLTPSKGRSSRSISGWAIDQRDS